MAVREAIQKTIDVWQPYYKQMLAPQDGEEILTNWSAYVGLLTEWTVSLKSRNEAQN